MTAATTAQMNAEQQNAHIFIVSYITERWSDADIEHGADKMVAWLLSGYAGTGKTFTLTEIVRSLRKVQRSNEGDIFGPSNYRIAMSAPTHKAVRVMKKFGKGFGNVHFGTIHSLLGLKEHTDFKTGKKSFVQSKDPTQIKIENFDVLFIDEASMLADELYNLLVPYLRRGLKIVFIGDKVQIPPVNHLDSKPFTEAQRIKDGIGMVELTSIVRQAMDNPILAYATRIRKAYQTSSQFEVETHIVGQEGALSGIVTLDNEADVTEIQGVLKDHFDCEEFRQDPDFMKVICWHNATVDQFNKEIRKIIYKDQPEPLPFLMAKEKLIVDEPVVLSNGRILLTTNEEIEVDHFAIEDGEFQYLTMNQVNRTWVPDNPVAKVKYYNSFMNYYDEEGVEQIANIRILHESEHLKLQGILKEIKIAATTIDFNSPYRSKLWQSFYSVDGKFAKVKYNYAITAHKSQGSTYDNTMMIDWDIACNPRTEERNRIRYVAATRARNLLFIVK